MHLTPDRLEAVYEYLRITPPFKRFRLPDADALEFAVSNHTDRYAHFREDGADRPWKTYAVSRRLVKTSQALLEAMSHEMTHHALRHSGSKDWHGHDGEFIWLAKQVCRYHGFTLETF